MLLMKVKLAKLKELIHLKCSFQFIQMIENRKNWLNWVYWHNWEKTFDICSAYATIESEIDKIGRIDTFEMQLLSILPNIGVNWHNRIIWMVKTVNWKSKSILSILQCRTPVISFCRLKIIMLNIEECRSIENTKTRFS